MASEFELLIRCWSAWLWRVLITVTNDTRVTRDRSLPRSDASSHTCHLLYTSRVQSSKNLFNSLKENLILSDLMHNRSIETLGVRTMENNYMFCPFVHLCEEQRNEESSGMKLFRKVFMACTLLALCALTLVWSRSLLSTLLQFSSQHIFQSQSSALQITLWAPIECCMSENLYAREKSVLENNSALELHPTSSDRVGWKIAQKWRGAVKQITLQILMRQYWLRPPTVRNLCSAQHFVCVNPKNGYNPAAC